MNRAFAELKSEIEAVNDPQHREISRAMATLVSARKVGPNADRLIEETGFCPEFVRGVIDHMTEAGLCAEGVVNEEEWWDGDDLNYFMLFIHAQVALGLLSRKLNSGTIEYLNKTTGKVLLKRHSGNE